MIIKANGLLIRTEPSTQLKYSHDNPLAQLPSQPEKNVTENIEFG